MMRKSGMQDLRRPGSQVQIPQPKGIVASQNTGFENMQRIAS